MVSCLVLVYTQYCACLCMFRCHLPTRVALGLNQAITFGCLVRFPVVVIFWVSGETWLVPWIFPAFGLIAVVDMRVTFSVLLMEDSVVVMQLGVVQCKA